MQLAGGLKVWWLHRVNTPRSLLCVVHLAFVGQEARGRQIRSGRFNRLPVVASQALFFVMTLFLVMMIHVGAAEIVSQFPFTRDVVECWTTLIPALLYFHQPHYNFTVSVSLCERLDCTRSGTDRVARGWEIGECPPVSAGRQPRGH